MPNNKIKLFIPTMKCNGCVATIEKALNDEVGITTVTIDLAAKTVILDADLTGENIINLVKSAGYESTVITPENLENIA